MRRGRFRRWIRDPLELGIAWLLYGVLRATPLDFASGLGGALARALGPRLGVNKIGEANLKMAFPEMPADERRRLLRDAWDNLGRTLFEYPHLDQILKERVTFFGLEHLEAFRDDGRCGIAFSGHFANWEILPAALKKAGLDLCTVYRAPNNPLIDGFLRRARGLSEAELAPKGAAGARRMLRHLKQGRHVGMLVDQKMNDGAPIPFFGRPAMTAPAIANLALKFDAPLLALQPVRVRGAYFRLIFYPLIEPRALAELAEETASQTAILTQINQIFETWVRDCPGQWLWFHRRWPKS